MARPVTLSALQPPFLPAATLTELRVARLSLLHAYLTDAARRGSNLALLPEQFNTFGLPPEILLADAAEPLDGRTVTEARRLARELAMALVLPIDAVDERRRFWNC